MNNIVHLKNLFIALTRFDKFIVFSHIEKCGGTSLHSIINDLIKGYFPLSSSGNLNKTFTNNALQTLLKIHPCCVNGIGGHSIIGNVEYTVPNREIFKFTFLRKPVERYLSHLNYQINVMNINWHINDFLDSEEFSNFQVKKICSTEDLESAKYILLNEMSFVGCIEFFNESIFALVTLLGLKKNLILTPKNVSKNIGKNHHYTFSDLSQVQKNKLLNNNKLDIELYEFYLSEIKKHYFDKYSFEKNNDFKKFIENSSKLKQSTLINNKLRLKNYITRSVFQPLALKLAEE